MRETVFSIVVPTYNRPDKLKHCLAAILALDYPRDCFELIIVDDGSTDPLEGVVASYTQSLKNVRLVRQQNTGPDIARNRGANVAQGRYLAFTDDDCAPEANWLCALEAVFIEAAPDAQSCLVGGKIVNRLVDNPFASASQYIVDLVYDHYNQNGTAARFFASNNLAVTREAFLDIGGFDTTFPFAAEDREFCHRWWQRGWSMRYAADAVIYHAHNLTFRSYVRQHFQYGRGALRYHRKRAEHYRAHITDEMDFYANIANWLRHLRQYGRIHRHATVAFGLLFVWQVANTLGYFYEQARHIRARDR